MVGARCPGRRPGRGGYKYTAGVDDEHILPLLPLLALKQETFKDPPRPGPAERAKPPCEPALEILACVDGWLVAKQNIDALFSSGSALTADPALWEQKRLFIYFFLLLFLAKAAMPNVLSSKWIAKWILKIKADNTILTEVRHCAGQCLTTPPLVDSPGHGERVLHSRLYPAAHARHPGIPEWTTV